MGSKTYDILLNPAVIDYITSSIYDAKTGADGSPETNEAWERVRQLDDPYICTALNQWYHLTDAEDEDPRSAILFLKALYEEWEMEDRLS